MLTWDPAPLPCLTPTYNQGNDDCHEVYQERLSLRHDSGEGAWKTYRYTSRVPAHTGMHRHGHTRIHVHTYPRRTSKSPHSVEIAWRWWRGVCESDKERCGNEGRCVQDPNNKDRYQCDCPNSYQVTFYLSSTHTTPQPPRNITACTHKNMHTSPNGGMQEDHPSHPHERQARKFPLVAPRLCRLQRGKLGTLLLRGPTPPAYPATRDLQRRKMVRASTPSNVPDYSISTHPPSRAKYRVRLLRH